MDLFRIYEGINMLSFFIYFANKNNISVYIKINHNFYERKKNIYLKSEMKYTNVRLSLCSMHLIITYDVSARLKTKSTL